MVNKIIILIFLVSLSLVSYSQSNDYDYVEDKPFLTKKEFAFSALLHTSGWGLSFRKGESLTVNKKRLYEIEFLSMKHPKEYKSVTYVGDRPKSFIYGKMNALLVAHGGYRFERILFSKTERNTFEIRFHATGGVSLGLTKPVYYIYKISNEISLIDKFNPDSAYAPEQIAGKAEFTKGFDEIKLYPGLYLKTGTMFEYNPLNDGITAIEVGMMLDMFGKKIPIMAYAKNKQIWFNFYATLTIGRKS